MSFLWTAVLWADQDNRRPWCVGMSRLNVPVLHDLLDTQSTLLSFSANDSAHIKFKVTIDLRGGHWHTMWCVCVTLLKGVTPP